MTSHFRWDLPLSLPSPYPLPAPVQARLVQRAGRGIKGEGSCAFYATLGLRWGGVLDKDTNVASLNLQSENQPRPFLSRHQPGQRLPVSNTAAAGITRQRR